MRLIVHKRLLPAVLLLAALIAQPLAISAQQTTPDAAAVPPAQPPPARIASHVTPEGVGDALLFRQRYQKAIGAYKKAPQNSSQVWNKMGIAYQMLFDLKDARRCYKESLRLNPRDPRVLNNLGTVYDAMQDHSKAERQYREALKLDPKSALVLRNLGTNLFFQNEDDQGWDMYKRALALNPNIFDGLHAPVTTSPVSVQQCGAVNYYKAKDYAQAGKIGRAIKYLRRALSEGFTSPRGIAQDSSFAPLRGAPAFQRLLAEQQGQ